MSGRLAFATGLILWVSALWGAALFPAEDARRYATFWTGAVALVAWLFVIGYVVLSRPSRDANGKRRWVGEWFWLPSLPAVIMLVYTNQIIFRMILPAPQNPTSEQILAQRFAAFVAATVFFLLLWLTALWVRRRIETARANKADSADYRNGWPPKA